MKLEGSGELGGPAPRRMQPQLKSVVAEKKKIIYFFGGAKQSG